MSDLLYGQIINLMICASCLTCLAMAFNKFLNWMFGVKK